MTRPKRPAPLPPGISRVDEPAYRKHGYVVRLQWVRPKDGRHNRPRIKQFFGDYGYGGATLALRAAVAFRKERVGE